jgi:8-oxo-dGTP pyrophosphatase MutT (NUDIX family)
MSAKKLYCVNCAKNTHNVKDCSEPVFSYGIICIKLDDKINILSSTIEKFLVNKLIDIEEYNFSNLNNLSKIDKYKDKIHFLFIQRKHSFSYVEFIRGKYDENNIFELTNLLNLMTKDEIEKILTNDFTTLWTDLWKKTSKHKAYQKEFLYSMEKFNKLDKKELGKQINFTQLYDTPEWGFPKGRRDKNEKNLECAIREFEEETGINQSKYTLLNRLHTVDESVLGTNNTLYKLVYYLGIINEKTDLKLDNQYQKYEVGDMKWLTFEETINTVRPYFKEKITMIYKIYFLFINIIENIHLQKQDIEKIDDF